MYVAYTRCATTFVKHCIFKLHSVTSNHGCLLSDLSNVICDSGPRQVVIGGDFNFDFHVENIGKNLFLQSMSCLQLTVCDRLLKTYFQLGSGHSSFIDHFVYPNLLHRMSKALTLLALVKTCQITTTAFGA